MLSGVGPADELSKHGIKQLIDAPEVGLNLHDHVSMAQFYKIKNPENNLVAGAGGRNDPSYLLGIPADLVVTASAPREALQAAMIKDRMRNVTNPHPQLQPKRGYIEILPIYAPTEAPLTELNIPFDGSCLTVDTLNLLPTSRGTVRLGSADPRADPLIVPNYYTTEADRVIIREGMRLAMRALEIAEGQAIVDREIVPAGFEALTSKSSDEEIDKRLKRSAVMCFHPAGSAAMGEVVDTESKVMGAERLRVMDASVLPCPIEAHYQVVTYALAEQVAEIITSSWRGRSA